MLDVAMAAAAVAAAVAATLLAALILFFLLLIAMPSRKTLCKSFIRRMSSLSWHESLFQSKISIVISVDIVFALTRFCNEFFNLHLHFLDRFLLFTMHGESELLCNYNEIMRRYCHCLVVQCGGRGTSIQGIKGGSLLLLLVLAVKNEGGVGCYEKGIVTKEQWNPKMLNPNGTYAGSSIKNSF